MTHDARALVPRVRHAPQREHPRVPGARPDRGGRASRGVLRGPPPLRAARAARRSTSPAAPTRSILDHLDRARSSATIRPQRSPLWSRTAYDRYLEWAFAAGTTDNGVFGAKLMWGYFGDFISLLRNIPAYRDLPLAELLPAVFPDLQFVRVVRANKVRQAVSLWKAVQTASWSEAQSAAPKAVAAAVQELPRGAPARACASTTGPSSTCSTRSSPQEAFWDTFFEHTGIKPILVLYENFAGDYTTSTVRLLERLGPARARRGRLRRRSSGSPTRSTTTGCGASATSSSGAEFDLTPAASAAHE